MSLGHTRYDGVKGAPAAPFRHKHLTNQLHASAPWHIPRKPPSSGHSRVIAIGIAVGFLIQITPDYDAIIASKDCAAVLQRT